MTRSQSTARPPPPVRTCLDDAGGLGMGLATDVAVGSEIGSLAGPAGIVVGIAIGLAASSRVRTG